MGRQLIFDLRPKNPKCKRTYHYHRTCHNCGAIFETTGKYAKKCPKCNMNIIRWKIKLK